MKLRTELPHFRAQCRDGAPWACAIEGLASFRSAWTAGHAFWSGTDIWGQPIDVKLADIVAVVVLTEESQLLGAEEDEEQKRREVVA